MNTRKGAVAIIGFVLAGLLALSLGAHARERDYPRVVAFGDSLSDPGNAFLLIRDVEVPPFELIPDAPYARGGLHFSNGRTWIEQLAGDLSVGVSAGPGLLKSPVFSNYAVGGARARATGPFDLGTQVNFYLAEAGGTASPTALYSVFAGSNDVRDALESLAVDPTGATAAGMLVAALTAVRDNIVALAGAGARTFLVPNMPNFALVPAVRLQGPAAQAAGQWLSSSYNDGLEATLSALEGALPVTIVRLDVYTLVNQVVAMPGVYGLAEVERTCITPGVRRGAYCSRPDDYLFWDGIHPTRAGHAILAHGARAALP